MNNLLQRAAVGDEARIGTFYNAQDDRFLKANLFGDQTPEGAVQLNPISTQKVRLDHDDSYSCKFETLGIGSSLAATILAGWIDCKGSLGLLDESRSHSNWSALYHTTLTMEEKLNLSFPDICDCRTEQPLHNVTHVVSAIQWGVRTVVTAQYPQKIHSQGAQSKVLMEGFKTAVEALQPGQDQGDCYMAESSEAIDIMIYSDIFQTNGIIVEDLQEAYGFFQILPLHIKDDNGGKGKPVGYSLLPIELLKLFVPIQLASHASLSLQRDDLLKSFISVFDEFQSCRRRLSGYTDYMTTKRQYLLRDEGDAVESCLERLAVAELALQARFPPAVQSARNSGSQSELSELLREYLDGESSPRNIAKVDLPSLDALSIVDELVTKGAIYVSEDVGHLERELRTHGKGKAYVLHFNRLCMTEEPDPSWAVNYNRFLHLLELGSTRSPPLFAIYNTCERKDPYGDFVHISCFHKGKKITEDLVEYEKFRREKCIAKCPSNTFETKDIKKPIKRRFVTMPCPSSACDQQLNCEWNCAECLELIEYGYTDDYFYCNCGRSKFSNYGFCCTGSSHGGTSRSSGFSRPDAALLLKMLRNLGSSNYINILILGETGVGKSTFINALVNYLDFATLDDAMAYEDLRWVIPCSFSTQFMNRDDPDVEIQEHFIHVGSRDDEKDGSTGDSATQRTSVYPVTVSFGSTTYLVRLIDTPGIGDTRGPDFDKQNMTDILTTISSYDELHGILILLKPNNSRLTVTFQYCVKELLVHLHQSAARNMVFGFTNTRITNYTPGDTFQPLKRLLGQNANMGISLSANTTYCFDSESFRYLAASKNGVEMPNKDDFDRSWRQSREETTRLIEHFKSIPPHLTKSTMSLNGARRSIQELTKPMADISEVIRKNILLVTQQKVELEGKTLTRDQLRNHLRVQKIQLKPKRLDKPRTVCTHRKCTEIRDDGRGHNEKVTVYKTHCHAECRLENVPNKVLAPAELIDCTAFGGEDTCKRCHHHWQEHMHVLVEMKEHTVTLKDAAVEQQLQDHADDITICTTAINQLDQTIEEYKQERDIIGNTTAKFGVFLKKHSITPINDTAEAYLHLLINVEKDKVEVGGNDIKLNALEEDLRRHKEAVEVLTRSMNSGATADALTEASVEGMIRDLYGLKHFGTMLQGLQHGISMAHEATNREIPMPAKRNPVNASGRRPPKLEIRSPNANSDGTVTKGLKIFGSMVSAAFGK